MNCFEIVRCSYEKWVSYSWPYDIIWQRIWNLLVISVHNFVLKRVYCFVQVYPYTTWVLLLTLTYIFHLHHYYLDILIEMASFDMNHEFLFHKSNASHKFKFLFQYFRQSHTYIPQKCGKFLLFFFGLYVQKSQL